MSERRPDPDIVREQQRHIEEAEELDSPERDEDERASEPDDHERTERDDDD
jgi:hypothetical protein